MLGDEWVLVGIGALLEGFAGSFFQMVLDWSRSRVKDEALLAIEAFAPQFAEKVLAILLLFLFHVTHFPFTAFNKNRYKTKI